MAFYIAIAAIFPLLGLYISIRMDASHLGKEVERLFQSKAQNFWLLEQDNRWYAINYRRYLIRLMFRPLPEEIAFPADLRETQRQIRIKQWWVFALYIVIGLALATEMEADDALPFAIGWPLLCGLVLLFQRWRAGPWPRIDRSRPYGPL